MICKTFECAEHEESGAKGWKEVGKHHFDPLPGLAVAHDCLEHFPDDDGSIHHEIMALGAMLHVRGNAFGTDHHEQWENLQSDMVDLFRLYRYEAIAFHAPTAVMEKPLRVSCDETFTWVEDQITKLIASLPAFLETEHYHGDDDDAIERGRSYIASFTRHVAGWLRHGYRRARRRYGTDHSFELVSMFRRVQEEADKQLKWAEEGATLKVCISPKRCEVTVTMREYQDPYGDN